jgi:hypothetical protein
MAWNGRSRWRGARIQTKGSSSPRLRVPNPMRIRSGGQLTRSGFGYGPFRISSKSLSGGSSCNFSKNAWVGDPGGNAACFPLIHFRILSMAAASTSSTSSAVRGQRACAFAHQPPRAADATAMAAEWRQPATLLAPSEHKHRSHCSERTSSRLRVASDEPKSSERGWPPSGADPSARSHPPFYL